jgi:hypothetical protein
MAVLGIIDCIAAVPVDWKINDGALEIDNNLIENAIRPSGVGRVTSDSTSASRVDPSNSFHGTSTRTR